MVKKFLIGCLSLLIPFAMLAQSDSKIESLKKDSKKAKAEFLKQDSKIEKFFKKSAGYVIFPNVGKGGLGVGGAAGNGIVYEGGKEIGAASLKQVTIGFQAGGQAFREVIFFEEKKDLEKFLGNSFEFSAQVSAIALTEGVSADAAYKDGVAVFTMSKKGLMYEASVGGQNFKYKAF